MLSVQTAGCAGMERLSVPTRTTLNTPPDDRGQYICRMHIDAARELLAAHSEPAIRGSNSSNLQQHHNNTDHTHQHHQQQHHLVNQRRLAAAAAAPASQPLSPASPTSTTTTTPASSGNHSISNSNNNTSNINNNSNNYNNNLAPMTNNITTEGSSSSSVIIKGGANEATHKYNNMLCCGSGNSSSGAGSGSSNGSCCLSVGGSQCSLSSHSNDHHQHYQHQLQQQKTLCCPHHVPLPDSEWIPADQRPAQLRSSYQHSELTRSYIKPPPNKTVKDVPDRSSYNFYSSSAHSSNSGLHSLASSQSLPISYSPSMASSTGSSNSSSSGSSSSVAQPKSKPNVITKFFYRKCSPKSPNNVASSASSSTAFPSASAGSTLYAPLASTSSIASSAASLISSAMASAGSSTSSTMSLNSQASAPAALALAPLPTLAISTAATLKTTPCDYGPAAMQHSSGTCVNNISAALVPSTQLLTTIGVSHPTASTTFPQNAMATGALERIPTPPLSVSVPINNAYQQHKQQQQHLLLDCLVGDSASVYSTLQTIKSSSCSPTLSANNTTTAAASNNASVKDDFAFMECQSGNITRNNSSSSMNSLTTAACNCQNSHCKTCNSEATSS